jgi:hypothetical protein
MKNEAVVKLVSGKSFQFEVQQINVTLAFFTSVSLPKDRNVPIYVEIHHDQLNTSIDLSHLNDTLVILFNEEDIMLGTTYVLQKSSGSFGIVTQRMRLLFRTLPMPFSPDEVSRITFS